VARYRQIDVPHILVTDERLDASIPVKIADELPRRLDDQQRLTRFENRRNRL
jgi:hypothetical protein